MKKIVLGILVFVVLASVVFAYYSESSFDDSCLSLSFDDGLKSHYEIVYPALLGRGFGGTFFVLANMTSFEGYELMNENEMRELYEDGFEIGSHTVDHANLNVVSEEELVFEVSESKRQLESYGFEVYSLAFPYGKFNDKVLEVSQRFYSVGRAIFNSEPRFHVYSYALEGNTSALDVCDKIKYAKENNLWLVLTMHDINSNPGEWETSIEDFNLILDRIDEAEIRAESIIDCKRSLE